MKIVLNSHTNGKHVIKSINGRDHMVTKVMPIRGNSAMNGLFYPLSEVKKSFDQLHNIPAPNSHPIVNGVHVSARCPLAMNAHNFGGFIQDPKMDGDKVQADFVLDLGIANQSDDGKELIKRIKNGDKIGVSTGLNIGSIENKSGVDDFGEKYEKIGRGYEFDHVAILLNEKAAGDSAGTEIILNEDRAEGDEPIFVVNVQTKPTPKAKKSNSKTTEVHEMNKDLFIAFMIANSANRFTDADKSRLGAMSESQLVAEMSLNMQEKENMKDAENMEDKKNMKTMMKDKDAFKRFKDNEADFNMFMKKKQENMDAKKEDITKNSDYTSEMLVNKSDEELTVIQKMMTNSKKSVKAGQGSGPADKTDDEIKTNYSL